MNDSNLHEISDGIGYSRSLILSIGIHLLLACGLWVGANINQPLEEKSDSTEKSLSPIARPVVLPAQALSGAPSINTGTASNQLLASESKRRASKPAENGLGTGHALQPALNVPAINRNTTAPKQARREPGKLAQLKKTEIREKTRAAKPSLQKKELAKTTAKTKHLAAKPITKAEQIRSAKKAVPKERKNAPNIAETKKLESMREAELRRISASVS
ncbi:hypothetical protein Q8A64_14500 [Oxalobacteraceae bacterium R-40]|uniref:Cell envelope biogenesis protein TolA n=1 Tax=Keguizhuia sedimenti TaxID=3064264 RepID=A0ABU1BRQ3_9BURK|nr:hypothetical protein [Oxalobacteraceae bacterium R-40]